LVNRSTIRTISLRAPPGLAEDSSTELERSEIRREFVFRDASMWQEPPPYQRRVALAGVDVSVSIDGFALSVNNRFSLVGLAVFEWLVPPKQSPMG
jgi:hypothetical protein